MPTKRAYEATRAHLAHLVDTEGMDEATVLHSALAAVVAGLSARLGAELAGDILRAMAETASPGGGTLKSKIPATGMPKRRRLKLWSR